MLFVLFLVITQHDTSAFVPTESLETTSNMDQRSIIRRDIPLADVLTEQEPNKPEFELWCEFEHWEDGWDIYNEFANISVMLPDGRKY